MSVVFARKRLEAARAALPDARASADHLIAAVQANQAAAELGADDRDVAALWYDVAHLTMTDWSLAAIEYAQTVADSEQRAAWLRFMRDAIGASFNWYAEERAAGRHPLDLAPIQPTVVALLQRLDDDANGAASVA